MADQIFIVDDEKNITFVISAMLERAGYKTRVFNESVAAIDAIESAQEADAPQVVITDLYMPGPGGMDVLQSCQEVFPHVPVVVITAYGSVESAVAALKTGAFDFITKPFDQTELMNVVQKAFETSTQRQKEPVSWAPSPKAPVRPSQSGLSLSGSNSSQDLLQNSPQNSPGVSTLIGKSSEMQDLARVIQKIAPSPSTVLILGESGTGKELVAYEIHRNSNRVSKPFIKINCAAIPASLIESELFGYEKGAFTGAVTSKPGRFELAHEGTLFLDEVAEMPPEMQVKLLRVLQEQEFERVGGVSPIKVDVRIIAATNKEIQGEIKDGKFREDLYYRLNVVPLMLPPLRNRRADIELLAEFFLQQFNRKLKKTMQGIDASCMAALKAYNWPGNIRQLENAMERMILMADGPHLHVSDLPSEVMTAVQGVLVEPMAEIQMRSPGNFKEIVRLQTQSVERELIEKALEETTGNVTRAAENLGLSRKGLQIKLKELGLKRGFDTK